MVGESDFIAPKAQKQFWPSSLSGAPQMDHCFQVKGLRKEVGEGDGLDLVAGSDRARAGRGPALPGRRRRRPARGRRSRRAARRSPRPGRCAAGQRRSGRARSPGARLRRRKASVSALTGVAGCAAEIFFQRSRCRRSRLDGDDAVEVAWQAAARRGRRRQTNPRPACPVWSATTRSTSASTSQRLT